MKKTITTFGKLLIATLLTLALVGCGTGSPDKTGGGAASNVDSEAVDDAKSETEDYSNSEDGGHAITADGETAEYSGVTVNKTGEADGDEADFYGENSAIFATNGATLDLSDIDVTTAGTHANAVFSYGEGTTVNISDSTITTSGNCSGGLMTTGGGTMNANNLTVDTSGNSSAAIRSDRGGGTVNVTGGIYKTSGTGSPAIYSTADITVSDASLTSTAAQGVVVEGKNSVTLKNVELNADNNTKNSDKSDYYQAVMIYQSMSGDADEGLSTFDMEGGTLTNANGDIFFVNNTTTNITLDNVSITNNGDGVFLRAAAAGWGKEGSNGGNVSLTANNQTIEGDMLVDKVSSLNMYLGSGSTYSGAINPDGAEGDVYVEIADDATWKLTGDSNITGLTCSEKSIDLNGHKLYVNGKEYTAGSSSEGSKVEKETETEEETKDDKADGKTDAKTDTKTDTKAKSDEADNKSDSKSDEKAGKADGETGGTEKKSKREKPEGTPPPKPSGSSNKKPKGTPPPKKS